MRFADIVIDLAAVVKASRSVASRHLELRARQLDRYSRTSSIVRSLREQPYEVRPRDTTATTEESGGPSKTSGQAREDKPPIQPSATHTEAQSQDSPISIKETSSAFKPHTGPALRNHDVPGDAFQSSSPKVGAITQKPGPIRPDQSAILTQLRGKANETQKDGEAGLETEGKPVYPPNELGMDGDVPSDVNINIFHTRRVSQALEDYKAALGRARPKAAPPTPSWFKDFGHGKPKTSEEEAKASLSVAQDAAEQISPTEKSTSGFEKGEGKKKTIESNANELKAQKEDIMPSSPAIETATEEVKSYEKASTDVTQGTISQGKETIKENVEEEPIQMASETLSRTNTDTDIPHVSVSQSLGPHGDEPSKPAYTLRESKVPATRLSRLWNYGGLAAGMLGGAISEGFSRGFGGGGQGSVLLSSGNMERLVAKLSRMRGAALKMGQMMSFQDSKMLPGPIQEVLQRVQDRADYMPAWQRDRVLVANLGTEWRDLFEEFEETPIAAASIGQVHRATLKSNGKKVAVKIQFPGVADSINSDLDNLSMLLTASKMLPKGLYLNKTIDNARTELGWECDYEREAECGQRYRELLADEADVFAVPQIYPEASGKHVLTMEFMPGTGVTRIRSFTQEQRDWIGTQILRLCLREITEFRFMQTDPNWTNFLYDAATRRLQLLDFGASRAFPEPFVRRYVALLAAASRADRAAVKDLSEALGYLTGHESRAMLDAHVASILTLAEPFLAAAPETYDFSDQTITERVRGFIPVMIRERLSPPPEETYSLHRKLSGAFLLCARLGSRVRCRELFETALEKGGYGGLLR
ncbi:ABC1 family-domain-containing protein [Biscogniauxia mediterranea]|nr:ABC1 family-domain-containing protein [Biscogniauxia mediterranea]